jgi:hypothetical protein
LAPNLRQDFPDKRFELKIFPEKIGLVGRQDIDDFRQFIFALRAIAEQIVILFKGFELKLLQAFGETLFEKITVLLMKEESTVLVDKVPQQTKFLIRHGGIRGKKEHLVALPGGG